VPHEGPLCDLLWSDPDGNWRGGGKLINNFQIGKVSINLLEELDLHLDR